MKSEVMFSGTSGLLYRFTPDFPGRDAVEGHINAAVQAADAEAAEQHRLRQMQNIFYEWPIPPVSTVAASIMDDVLHLTVSLPNPAIRPGDVHAAIVGAVGPISRAP